MYGVLPLGNFVSQLIIGRAWEEIGKGDSTLAIVLSAMSVECEMSWLFFKWKEVDVMPIRTPCIPAEREMWEHEWEEIRTIWKRLHELSLFMTGTDFDRFVSQKESVLFESIRHDYDPQNNYMSPKKFFQEQLFDKRNRIVHSGYIDFKQEEGEMCFALASALLQILRAMNVFRIKRMDEEHDKVPG
jgi:hypothetical protein